MNDNLIPVAPGFDAPLEMVEACHERLQGQLGTLARLLAWLSEHGADSQAQQAASAVMRYFDLAAVNHHLDEEEDLFPALLARAEGGVHERLQVLVDELLADHQQMYAGWAAMRAVLLPISRGESAQLEASAVSAFAERYQHHIEREEGELLPMARILLSEEDQRVLGERMTARRRQPPAG